jgi:hypothetical protein
MVFWVFCFFGFFPVFLMFLVFLNFWWKLCSVQFLFIKQKSYYKWHRASPKPEEIYPSCRQPFEKVADNYLGGTTKSPSFDSANLIRFPPYWKSTESLHIFPGGF